MPGGSDIAVLIRIIDKLCRLWSCRMLMEDYLSTHRLHSAISQPAVPSQHPYYEACSDDR